jgi:predicted ATPase/DNA-binding CsgD family transcriptional regulator
MYSPPQESLSARQAEIAAMVARGKSSREIAEALFLSPRTVENHITAIFNKLGIRSRVELTATLLNPNAGASGHPIATHVANTNLPLQRTSLIGRETEIADIVGILQHSRLVTVTGAGGVGKTRTALAVGDALLEGTTAGVWFVDLAPLTQGSYMATAVAQALNVQESPHRPLLETLLAYLKRKQLLLILDNCEHVTAEAAALADALLRDCPHLRILATSRERLRIAGERAYRLPSLLVPRLVDASRLSAAGAAEYSAVVLFAQRAQAIDHRFALTDDNAPVVAEICRRLDGIPLAIELAAGRVNILPVRALFQNLDQRLRVLARGDRTAPPRHQTMRALIDWSYELLDERERALLRRVSVFANGFGLEGAAAVDADLDELDAFEVLASLVEKSMVVAESDEHAMRYRLLESTRAYALEKLEAAGEHRACITRHLHYLRNIFCEARLRVDGSGCSRELDALLSMELEDVRMCLDGVGASAEPEVAAELLAAIENRWIWIDIDREGVERLERVIALMPTAQRRLTSRLWTALARTVTNNGARAREASAIAVDLARQAGDADTLADALTMRADALLRPGAATLKDGVMVLAEAESLVPDSNIWLHLRTRRVRANAMRYLGELDAAAQAYGQLRDIHLQLRNTDEASVLALNLAATEHQRQQTEKAIALLQEVLPALRTSRFRDLHLDALADLCGYLLAVDRLSEACALVQEVFTTSDFDGSEDAPEAVVHAALVVALHGNIRRGALLAGYAELALNRLGRCRDDPAQTTRERLEALLHERLEPEELEALLTTGAALPAESAVALVRESLDDKCAKSRTITPS